MTHHTNRQRFVRKCPGQSRFLRGVADGTSGSRGANKKLLRPLGWFLRRMVWRCFCWCLMNFLCVLISFDMFWWFLEVFFFFFLTILGGFWFLFCWTPTSPTAGQISRLRRGAWLSFALDQQGRPASVGVSACCRFQHLANESSRLLKLKMCRLVSQVGLFTFVYPEIFSDGHQFVDGQKLLDEIYSMEPAISNTQKTINKHVNLQRQIVDPKNIQKPIYPGDVFMPRSGYILYVDGDDRWTFWLGDGNYWSGIQGAALAAQAVVFSNIKSHKTSAIQDTQKLVRNKQHIYIIKLWNS